MVDPVNSLDVVEKLVHIFGIPAIVGAIVWMMRKYDAGEKGWQEIRDNTKLSVATAAEVKLAVDTMQTNHLAHISEDIKSLHSSETKTIEVLTSIDKGIAVLVDRARA